MVELVLIVVACWVTTGVALSFQMAHRGYDRFGWFVMGVLLGPLAVALAIYACHEPESRRVITVASSPVRHHAGHVDVLVGYDGSAESDAALISTIELLGVRLGRLSIATVVPIEGATAVEAEARCRLKAMGERFGWLAPSLEVLHGRPADALAAFAIDGGFDILAIGRTGAGRAHRWGSAARELVESSPVPVLVGVKETSPAKRRNRVTSDHA
jgi:nucleotide-binding universal stress UspA family protein